MDGNELKAFDTAMAALAARIVADGRLEAELHRARRTFFGTAADADELARDGAAERRFLEWFALERESDTLGDVPVAIEKYAAAEDLEGSIAGAFLVTSIAPPGAIAKDLQDRTMLDFVVPAESLAVGDLVVGRLFAVGAGQWLPSTAASVFRPGASLGEAFVRDVARLDLGRRLEQIELEHALLLQQRQAAMRSPVRESSAPLEHLEADLDRLLQGQAMEYSVTGISEQLAATARPGPVIGPLLDGIAFETKADLDAVRRVLLLIWNAHHAGDGEPDTAAPADGPPGESLGERMVRQLDDGIRSQRDLEALFGELEEMAGLEPGAADDAENPFDREEGAPEPLAGDLAPLVEEYLWENGLEAGEVTTVLRTWVELQHNAALPRSDLDQVTGTDLMRVLLHLFLAAAPQRRAAAVRSAFSALREFYDWAERTQQLELGDNLAQCRGALLDQLDRLAGAGASLSSGSVGSLRPALFEIEEIGPRGFGMRDDDGDGHWLDVPATVTAQLAVGDLVLGALAAGPAFRGPVVVLPAEARSLME